MTMIIHIIWGWQYWLSALIFFTCGAIFIKLKQIRYLHLAFELKLNMSFTWGFKFFKGYLEIIFWCGLVHKIEHLARQDKNTRLLDTCKLHLWRESPSMNLWHYIFRVPFHGEVYVNFFKKVVPSLTSFIFVTQICHWLRWLRCFARLHKNTLLGDYSEYADLHEK